MASPTTQKVEVTMEDQSIALTPATGYLVIKNRGPVDVWIDFDKVVGESSYLLESGEVREVARGATALHYKAPDDSREGSMKSVLYIIEMGSAA